MDVSALKDRDTAVAAARSLGERIEAAVPETDRLGHMPDDLFQAIADSGLYRLGLPEEFGGAGAHIATFIEVVEEISRADPSTGWSFMANSGSVAILSAHLPQAGAERIFGTGELTLTAGMLAPTGVATKVEGGYRVSGKYGFASGSAHASWICAGARVDDEKKTGIMLAVPRSEVEFLGNWDVIGLRGTGSVDYRLDDVFVPEDSVFLREGAKALRGQPSLKLGLLVGLVGHVGVALGTARRALEELVKIADMGRGRPGVPPMREQPHFLHEFAVNDYKYRSARSYVLESLNNAVAPLAAGEPLTAALAGRVQQATTMGVRMASEVVTSCYGWSGSVGLRRPHPLGRLVTETAGQTQHGLVDPNSLVFAGPGLMDDYRDA